MLFQKETLRKIVAFTFWGVLTTALNIVLYYCFRKIHIPVQVSTILSWFFCVLFAFLTNKKYVFRSNNTTVRAVFRELVYFYGSRMLSGLLDVVLMTVFIDFLKMNEILAKIIVEIIVSACNFLLSFFVIFKEKKQSQPQINDKQTEQM